MNEYILIYDPNSVDHQVDLTSHGIIDKFQYYEEAKERGEDAKSMGDCEEYAIYTLVVNP